MATVAFSVPLADGVVVQFHRDLTVFDIRIGSYTVTLRGPDLSVEHYGAGRHAVLIRVPAEVAP